MSSDSIEERLLNYVAELTGNPRSELTLESSMHDTHGWNSLNHLEIINYIEGQVGKRLSIDEIIFVTSIQDCLNIIKSYELKKK